MWLSELAVELKVNAGAKMKTFNTGSVPIMDIKISLAALQLLVGKAYVSLLALKKSLVAVVVYLFKLKVSTITQTLSYDTVKDTDDI